jgi:hypothetical protein
MRAITKILAAAPILALGAGLATATPAMAHWPDYGWQRPYHHHHHWQQPYYYNGHYTPPPPPRPAYPPPRPYYRDYRGW